MSPPKSAPTAPAARYTREWVPEAPVALEFNGLSYAVMMATPADLEDFARGFALTEGLAKTPADVTDIAVAETDLGWIVRASLAGLGVDKLTERVRTRVAESSCGLCGIENLEAVARPLPKVAAHAPLDRSGDLRRACRLARPPAAHPRDRRRPRRRVLLPERRDPPVREDVGRHNALDKLVGALAAAGEDPAARLHPLDRALLVRDRRKGRPRRRHPPRHRLAADQHGGRAGHGGRAQLVVPGTRRQRVVAVTGGCRGNS